MSSNSPGTSGDSGSLSRYITHGITILAVAMTGSVMWEQRNAPDPEAIALVVREQISNEIRGLNNTIDSISEENVRLLDDIKVVQQENESTEEELEKTEKELEKMAGARDQIQQQSQQLKQINEQLQAEAERIPDLEQAVAKSGEQIVVLNGVVANLSKTVNALTEQKKAAKKALMRAEAKLKRQGAYIASLRYDRFALKSTLTVCSKGNASRMAECRSKLSSALKKQGIEDRYKRCINTKNAEPMVVKVSKGNAPPSPSIQLTDYPTFGGSAWYVVLCDMELSDTNLVRSANQ